jgi:tetrahydromethanopterin S-methyltransferase subunit H
MFRFQNEQKILDIGGVNFGGQPGERRTVIIGSLFYPSHSMVSNRRIGEIDKEKLDEVLGKLHSSAEETGTPAAIMLYGETGEAISNYLRILSERTSLPLFIDSSSPDVRLSGVKSASEMGILNRVIYNSINSGTTEKELEGIQEYGLRNAVLLAFSPKDFGLKGKIYLLEDGGGILKNGLVDLAERYGIDRPLLDLAVMSMDQGAGSALRAIFVSKAKWGLPSGCALHNAVESWAPLANVKAQEPALYRYVDEAACSAAIMAGADFLMFGPLEASRRVIYAATFTDELMHQASLDG